MRVDSNKTGRNVKGSNCVLLLPIPVRLLVPPTLERSAITRNGFIAARGQISILQIVAQRSCS